MESESNLSLWILSDLSKYPVAHWQSGHQHVFWTLLETNSLICSINWYKTSLVLWAFNLWGQGGRVNSGLWRAQFKISNKRKHFISLYLTQSENSKNHIWFCNNHNCNYYYRNTWFISFRIIEILRGEVGMMRAWREGRHGFDAATDNLVFIVENVI